MPRLTSFAAAAILAALAALAFAAVPAGAALGSSTSSTPAWSSPGWWSSADGPSPPVAAPPTISDPPPAVDPPPTDPPAPESCPSAPTSQAPIDACPLDPNGWDFDTGDQSRCNYYTGDENDPCPRADADYFIARCTTAPDAGEVWHALRSEPDATCDGGLYVILDDGNLPPGVPEPPPASTCPSLPASSAPVAGCPDDPAGGTCNYDSGSAGDPCPHSKRGDLPWYFRCVDSGLVGVEFGWVETDPLADADVTDNCGGAWVSLSLAVER